MKNEKQHRLLFIIPAVIIAIISYHMYSSGSKLKIRRKGEEKRIPGLSV